MSEIKYGLISETDGKTIEKTLDLIWLSPTNPYINVLEIGVYSGETGNGIREYIKEKGYYTYLTGIDNNKDKEPLRFQYDKLIIGDSNEVYNKIEDNSQDLIFVDGDHSFAGVIADFFCYAPKVKVGGYMAFHDTGKHIKPFKDFQHGDRDNPDAYISVRKALEAIGLGEGYASKRFLGWMEVFDQYDPNDEAGGIRVFKKL